MRIYSVLLLGFLFQNALASNIPDIFIISDTQNSVPRRQSTPKLLRVPSYTFTGEDQSGSSNIIKTDRDITFLPPSKEGFLDSITTGKPCYFTGMSPKLPASQDIIMELSAALTPSFLKNIPLIPYCVTFFPSTNNKGKSLMGIALPTGGIDPNTRSLIATFNSKGYHVVVPHSEKSRFATGSETKADQLKLSGLSCFWDILESMDIVLTYLKIEKCVLYGASRGATILQYGLMTNLLKQYFPKINLRRAFFADLLPLVQLNDEDMKSYKKSYKEIFFMGQKDDLHDPQILKFYTERLKLSKPSLVEDSSSSNIYLYDNARHYFSNLTLQEEVKTFTSYSPVCLVIQDSLDAFNGEKYFPFLKKLIALKNESAFVDAVKKGDEEKLEELLASVQEASWALKLIQALPPQDPFSLLTEENFMHLVWTFLPHTLKGFSRIGTTEYQGDGVHPYEPWTNLTSYFLGSQSLLEKRTVTFKADLTTRNQHIEDIINNLNEMTLSPPVSLTVSTDTLRKSAKKKKD